MELVPTCLRQADSSGLVSSLMKKEHSLSEQNKKSGKSYLYSEWEKNVYKKFIKNTSERKNEFTTASFTPVNPLYTPADLQNDYDVSISYPGKFPFTRGIHPSMYRGKFWTMRQYAGFGTARESNERYRYLLKQGQSGLSVAFDLPTQIGYDSDDPIA